MRKTTKTVAVYSFDDMDVYVICNKGIADIYATTEGYALQHQVGVEEADVADGFIKGLHDSGYFCVGD